MTDFAQRVAEIIEGFERGEFEAMWERYAGQTERKSPARVQMWWPTLDGMIGPTRRITDAAQVADSPPAARVVLRGETGDAAVTMYFDDDGRFTELGVADWPLILGIGNLQIDCPNGTVPDVARLYGALLGIDLPEQQWPNWMVLAKDKWTKPALPFAGQAPEWRPASWSDPQRQQQVHLELFVRDVTEAAGIAERSGATLVDDDVWADQAGHGIRLVHGDSGDAPGVIGRIVLDCDDPNVLATFYAELLGMHAHLEEGRERVVIGHDDGRLPQLAFRHVRGHTPPRYPDPAFPQQMHMDIKFEDFTGAQRTAERLGGARIANPGGHEPVYADPAGHPFCVCFPGQ